MEKSKNIVYPQKSIFSPFGKKDADSADPTIRSNVKG
jgi:hypothetical protein